MITGWKQYERARANAAKTQPRGFTIVEIVIVIAVVAMLAAVTLVGYGNTRATTDDNALKSTLQSISDALELYKQYNNGYPQTQTGTLVNGSTNAFVYADINCTTPDTPASVLKTEEWVPGIDFDLPQSSGQKGARGNAGCFLYQSDGTSYILSAWNMAQTGPVTDSKFYRRVGFRENTIGAQFYLCNHVNIGAQNPAPYDATKDYYKYSFTLSNIKTCNETSP